jgi:hypothetical protein
VDLFTRETLLQWLPSREQTKVAQTILRRIVLDRGVPISLRSDCQNPSLNLIRKDF